MEKFKTLKLKTIKTKKIKENIKIVSLYLQCPLSVNVNDNVSLIFFNNFRKVSIFLRCPNYPGGQIKDIRANVE